MTLKGIGQTITGDESNGSMGLPSVCGMSVVDIPDASATRQRVTRGPENNEVSFLGQAGAARGITVLPRVHPVPLGDNRHQRIPRDRGVLPQATSPCTIAVSGRQGFMAGSLSGKH